VNSSPRIPVLVIAGYLGAGKTTLINQVLHNATQKIAVIVNDFGSINIDASLIAEKHDDTIELTNGCICCAVGESLADVLFAITDRVALPDLVIIEASGVADPSAVAAFTHIDGFHHLGNVVLVDAHNALSTAADPLVGRTFRRQVEAANLLVLTKSDVVTIEHAAEVMALLGSLAPTTAVLQSSSASVAEILANTSATSSAASESGHTTFSSMTLDHFSAVDEEQLRNFVNNFPPSVVRAKGIVELSDGTRRLIQKVGSTVTISETALPTSGLVVILAE
jgi:G3E family GTPase